MKESHESLAEKFDLLYGQTNSKLEHGCVKPYFLKNGRISVVLVMNKTGRKVIARGAAACDFNDKLRKGYGISKARSRAFRKLLGREKGTLPVTNPVSKKIFSGTGIEHKAELNPQLTEVEQEILKYI